MNAMPIYIPSSGRAHLQHTLENLTPFLRARVRLVVQHSQREEYVEVAQKYNVGEFLVLPKNITTISPTRKWIVEHADSQFEDKFFICDDDLKFAYREFWDLGDTKLTHCNHSSQLEIMFALLETKLDEYAHVGISARSGNNNVLPKEDGSYSTITRMMCLTGYQTEKAMMCEHNRVKCRSDFDLHLQLLRFGFPNWVSYDYCHDQPGSNTEGGCSVFRDADMLKEEAEHLAELHPGFVNVVEKKTKADWGVGGVRTDTIIYWKKAFEKGQYSCF